MKLMISVACVVGVVALCSAHMCLINPRQRGSMNGFNMPAAKDCTLTMAPCGGRIRESPTTVLKAGGNFSVTFQKNLNHWTSATPGYFAVNMVTSAGMTREIARVPDNNEPNLHLYHVTGTLPLVRGGRYILQVTYVTRNPYAPAVFYQCADVMVM